MQSAIAGGLGVPVPEIAKALSQTRFLPAMLQKSDPWLGQAAAEHRKKLADFLVEQGRLMEALEDYSPYVTTRFLRSL